MAGRDVRPQDAPGRTALRNRIYSAFEAADRADDPAVRDAWMTFVVVGGGATGVEVSGAAAVLANHLGKRTFKRIEPANARIVLLDAGDRVVPTFSPGLSAKAGRYLGELGVTVRDRARATEIDADGVTFQVGDRTERLGARTVIWAAGVQAAPLSATLPRPPARARIAPGASRWAATWLFAVIPRSR